MLPAFMFQWAVELSNFDVEKYHTIEKIYFKDFKKNH